MMLNIEIDFDALRTNDINIHNALERVGSDLVNPENTSGEIALTSSEGDEPVTVGHWALA